MQIHGLQKMTLLDFPGKVACTVFLGGCDFRCPFCHNFELVDGSAKPLMDDAALLDFLRKRRGLLEGVAFTGGEPCLHPELPRLMEEIRGLGYQIKLDTNGFHPALLAELLERGLVDYVAMDVKNSPEKYAATCGLASLSLAPIRESIALLREKAMDYEFRTTVVTQLHEEVDFEAIGSLIEGARRYFLQSFTDRASVPFSGFTAPTPAFLRRARDLVAPHVQEAALRGVEE
ncbi:MAG: anaerobic ribonucleoside-triphosphate reductase activating protein [bacterium]